MSRPERRYLIRIGRRSGDPDTAMRFHAVGRLAAGRSTVEAANDLDIARSTVVRAAAKFEERGVDGLFDQRRGNGGAKVDDAFRRRLVQLLKRTPEHFGWKRPTWTDTKQRPWIQADIARTLGEIGRLVNLQGPPSRSSSELSRIRATSD